MRSSISKKAVMALTGVLLFVFVLGHLLGNLQIFLGPVWLNGYARHLEELPFLLWPARVVLLAALAAHILTAIQLSAQNRSARPTGYQCQSTIQASYASRTMVFSGVIVLAFIIYHLLHYTFRVVHPEYAVFVDADGHRDVYAMVVLSFRQLPITSAYLVGVGLLGWHLSHGVASLFQSLGASSAGVRPKLVCAGRAVGFLIFLGYASIPVAVWLRLIGSSVKGSV